MTDIAAPPTPTRTRLGRSLRRLHDRLPDGVRPRVRPLLERLDLYLVDHGFIRALYANRHRVGARVWRSAQPAPIHLAALARRGLRTVVNLRGDRDCGGNALARAACARLGLTLVDFPLGSREAPSKARLRGAADLFGRIEYPALFHCKSGADRVGLMSALYLLLHEGRSLDEARAQLHWRYGHVRQAKTGVLDAFFASFGAAQAETGIGFWEWVDTVYDPARLQADFRAGRLAELLMRGRE